MKKAAIYSPPPLQSRDKNLDLSGFSNPVFNGLSVLLKVTTMGKEHIVSRIGRRDGMNKRKAGLDSAGRK